MNGYDAMRTYLLFCLDLSDLLDDWAIPEDEPAPIYDGCRRRSAVPNLRAEWKP